jgi:uncharacterized protein (DUF2147 family)
MRMAGLSKAIWVSMAMALGCAPLAAQAADATGVWLRATGTARIKIVNCGAALCGSVSWLKEPNGPDGKPRVDDQNPDPAKRSRPALGIPVILGMKPTGKTDQWKGEVYKADEGKTYTGFLTVLGPRELKLEGCVLGGMICKAETLTRVE